MIPGKKPSADNCSGIFAKLPELFPLFQFLNKNESTLFRFSKNYYISSLEIGVIS